MLRQRHGQLSWTGSIFLPQSCCTSLQSLSSYSYHIIPGYHSFTLLDICNPLFVRGKYLLLQFSAFLVICVGNLLLNIGNLLIINWQYLLLHIGNLLGKWWRDFIVHISNPVSVQSEMLYLISSNFSSGLATLGDRLLHQIHMLNETETSSWCIIVSEQRHVWLHPSTLQVTTLNLHALSWFCKYWHLPDQWPMTTTRQFFSIVALDTAGFSIQTDYLHWTN